MSETTERKPPLFLEQAITDLQRLMHYTTSRNKTATMQLKVFNPGSVGGTPTVGITGFQGGIDWDAGKILVRTEHPVSLLTAQQLAEIHVSARAGQSWHAYQVQKHLRERIRALEAELAALKGGV